MPKKVSIIVPIYNVEQYLVEALDSLVNQTLNEIEILCINDGSTDNCLSILNNYAKLDSRIIIIDKKNEGYGASMNLGINSASGEYIGILEPDDFVSLNMYEDLYDVASKNDLDFVKADFYRFVGEGDDRKLSCINLSPNKEDYNKVFNPSKNPMATKFVMNTWSGIYKRSFIEKYNIRHNTTPGASYQDNGFWIQTFMFATRAMIVDKPYYMNRRDNPNSSVNNPNKVYAMNIEYDHIRDIFMEHHDIWERFKGAYWYKKYYSYEASLKRIADQYKMEYLDRFSREFKRGQDLGEIDYTYFSQKGKNDIELLIKQPKEYFNKYFLKKGPICTSATLKFQSIYEKIKKRIPKKLKNQIKRIIKK